MACHEIAALRLGLMRVLGTDEAERRHELAELGGAAAGERMLGLTTGGKPSNTRWRSTPSCPRRPSSRWQGRSPRPPHTSVRANVEDREHADFTSAEIVEVVGL